MNISGQLIDIRRRRIYPAALHIENGKIARITPVSDAPEHYILPGFVDAHVHIESSMLVPSEFAKKAVVHGTVATVSDPHEIANVLGKEGVYYMLDNAQKVPFKFNFGAPSCVPATIFETAGAEVTVGDIDEMLQRHDIKYLAEMMNYPGVLYNDPSVLAKLEVAKRHQKPIDGHAPGLMGELVLNYMSKGISTDHECYKHEEALFKLQNGMKVIIREGSAAKNFNTLAPLIPQWSSMMMFCSDDKHPDDLILGHINLLVKRALALGFDLFDVLQMACINPVEHYRLDVGTLQVGYAADFIVIDNPIDFNILQTYIDGVLVAENGHSFIKTKPEKTLNNFNIGLKKPSDFDIPLEKETVNVIECLDGQLITNKIQGKIIIKDGKAAPSVLDDILKIVVVNRYHEAAVAVAFIKNFGLKSGAIASSVAHDSHNIIAVGVDDISICEAVNGIIAQKGGLAATNDAETLVLGLPVAGLMSTESCEIVAAQYERLVRMAKDLGSTLGSPFMSLSFMALLVIPSLKLSDKGLFDGEKFTFCPLETS
jgi:adenine deaminase